MLSTCFFVGLFWFLFHLATCKKNEVRNGCSSDDLPFFHDVSAQYLDLFSTTQNVGSLIAELETFMEDAVVPELEYTLFVEDMDITL